MGTTIVIIITAVIVAAVFAMLVTLRINAAQVAKRYRQQRRTRPHNETPAQPGGGPQTARADALVLEAGQSPVGKGETRARVTLTLQVTPPQGVPYRATAVWRVDADALHMVLPGNSVPVTLGSDPKTVLPAAGWAASES